VNHSCDPNTYELFEEGSAYLVARREIAAGGEITCDYNINIANGTAWPCQCGAIRCQGQVVGDFFRLPKQWQLCWWSRSYASTVSVSKRLIVTPDRGAARPNKALELTSAVVVRSVRDDS